MRVCRTDAPVAATRCERSFGTGRKWGRANFRVDAGRGSDVPSASHEPPRNPLPSGADVCAELGRASGRAASGERRAYCAKTQNSERASFFLIFAPCLKGRARSTRGRLRRAARWPTNSRCFGARPTPSFAANRSLRSSFAEPKLTMIKRK